MADSEKAPAGRKRDGGKKKKGKSQNSAATAPEAGASQSVAERKTSAGGTVATDLLPFQLASRSAEVLVSCLVCAYSP